MKSALIFENKNKFINHIKKSHIYFSIIFHLPSDRLFIVVLPNSIHFELIFMVALRKFEYTIKIALWQIHVNLGCGVSNSKVKNLLDFIEKDNVNQADLV